MEHLLTCPMRPQECTTKDLMECNEAAKECVFQWMKNWSRPFLSATCPLMSSAVASYSFWREV